MFIKRYNSCEQNIFAVFNFSKTQQTFLTPYYGNNILHDLCKLLVSKGLFFSEILQKTRQKSCLHRLPTYFFSFYFKNPLGDVGFAKFKRFFNSISPIFFFLTQDKIKISKLLLTFFSSNFFYGKKRKYRNSIFTAR